MSTVVQTFTSVLEPPVLALGADLESYVSFVKDYESYEKRGGTVPIAHCIDSMMLEDVQKIVWSDAE